MDDDLNISYDRFIRTTEPAHHQASEAIWRAMAEQGDLYLGRYEGWYSVRDEAYYGEEELVVADSGEKLSPQGTLVEWTVEESWFFRLSAYQERLLAHYEANPDFIRPETRRNEVLRFVEGGLADLSISRTSFDWGVKVPGSDNHVMYVWLDALTNYLTGLGYPDDTEAYRTILACRYPHHRQGCGPLSRGLLARLPDVGRASAAEAGVRPRPYPASGARRCRSRRAMSSIAADLIRAFGVDPLRYFLLREVTFGQDGGYTTEAIVNRVNADLANAFGNLAQRTLSFIARNCDGVPPIGGKGAEADADLLKLVREAARTELPPAFRGPGAFAGHRGLAAARSSPATNISTPRRPGRCARPIRSG